jgi:transcriptional regulator GlxA family with amidase domain
MIPALDIAVLVFPDVEPLDAIGPLEVFGAAALLMQEASAGDGPPPGPIPRPVVVGVGPGPVRTRHGLTILPEHDLRTAPPPDPRWVLVPGGDGSHRVAEDPVVLGWLARLGADAAGGRRIMSVCTGTRVLAAAGLLAGRRITSHATALEELRRRVPDADVRPDARWVRDGHVWTSGGVTAGIDMAVAAVADLAGEAMAEQVARYLEHPWPPPVSPPRVGPPR